MNRKKRSARKEQIRAMVPVWQSSGKSLGRFCRDEQLAYHSFKYYLKKWGIRARKKSNEGSADSFIPLVIKPESNPSSIGSDKIEILCPNGIEIRLPGNTKAGYIKIIAGIQ